MDTTNQAKITRQLSTTVRVLAIVPMAAAGLSLLGWFFHIEGLVRLGHVGIPIRFNTALCLLIAAVALWRIGEDARSRWWLARLCGSVLVLVSLLTICEYLTGWDLRLDQLLLKDTISESDPGRMAPITALYLLLAGTFFLLARAERPLRAYGAQGAAALATMLAQWGLLDVLVRNDLGTGIAVNTACILLALSLGMILIPSACGPLAIVSRATSGGRILRRLLPAAILVPLALGWLRWYLAQEGAIDTNSGISIMVVGTTAALLVVSGWTATSIDAVAAQRQRLEQELSGFFKLPLHSLLAIIGFDGYFKRISTSWQSTLGYGEREILDRPYLEFVHPEDRGATLRCAAEIAAGHSVALFENRYHTADGSYRDLLWNVIPSEGAVMYAVAEDITERKRAEEQLRRASHYARSLLEASLDPLVTIDRQGTITDVNEATERVTGVDRDKLIGSDFSDYFTEPDKARKSYRQVFAEGQVTDYALAIRNVSGALTHVLYNATLFRNQAGEIEGVFAAARDVTERKRAEEQLRRAARYARSLLEASLDPLVTIDRQGTITDVNEATERVTGIDRDKLIGSDFSDYFTEPDQARKSYRQVFAEGQVTNYALAIRNASGTVTDVLYNATLFRNEGGEIEGVFAAARDVTEKKRAEERLLQFNAHLEQTVEARTAEVMASNKELEAFAYSVSHDLRAPLRHMDGFLSLLRKRAYGQLDAIAQSYIDKTTAASHRMAILIDELLQFSRLGRSQLHKMPLDLKAMVEDVIRELQPETAGRVVRWRVERLPHPEGDPVLLRLLMQNLLSNALKFTRPRAAAEICLRAQRGADGADVITVQDNGVGFDMEYYNKLFQVFQRLHRESEFEGVGIGLANVRRIVERHGGRVWAESEVGKGATFYFSLPAASGTAGQPEDKGAADEQLDPHLVSR